MRPRIRGRPVQAAEPHADAHQNERDAYDQSHGFGPRCRFRPARRNIAARRAIREAPTNEPAATAEEATPMPSTARGAEVCLKHRCAGDLRPMVAEPGTADVAQTQPVAPATVAETQPAATPSRPPTRYVASPFHGKPSASSTLGASGIAPRGGEHLRRLRASLRNTPAIAPPDGPRDGARAAKSRRPARSLPLVGSARTHRAVLTGTATAVNSRKKIGLCAAAG